MQRISRNIVITWMKIVMAAGMGIWLANMLQLEFTISAGVIAILTIQPTKKETINTALGRLYAFLIALMIAAISFGMFGFTYLGFFVFLIPYIFLCQLFGWYSAMGMNAVLVSHFISSGSMNPATIGNEVLIFSIGVGIGIIANLHLRKRVETIERMMKATDARIVAILKQMSERILDSDMPDNNGVYFRELKEQMEEAKEVAEENFNNQFDSNDIYDVEYLKMREKQCLVLFEMYKTIRQLETSPHTAERLSDFLKRMAEAFQRSNNGREILEEFIRMDLYMKSQPLPVERGEFEDRARLFALMRHIEEFIRIKMEFADRFS